MLRYALLLAALTASPSTLHAQGKILAYEGRYNCQGAEPDHLLAATGLSGNRAIVAGNRGLAMLDLSQLPKNGTRSYLSRLTGVNARDLCLTQDQQYVFVNEHRRGTESQYGFAVVRIVGTSMRVVARRAEQAVLYEKMCLDGKYLYVAAHRRGIRIFDVTNPSSPTLAGKLETGFVNAIDCAVDGNTLYVADGAGGLAIVDIANKAAPRLLASEGLHVARGTYEDVLVEKGHVYVAAMHAGVAVYPNGKLAARRFFHCPGTPESLAMAGAHLAVGTIAGVAIFSLGTGTDLELVADERAHRRGMGASLRIASGIGTTSNDRVMVGNWNFMDVYRIADASTVKEPDIDASEQRLRFPPTGGTQTLSVRNDGSAPLLISRVQIGSPDFTSTLSPVTLAPGEGKSFDVTYKGGGTSGGSSTLLISCNDPDEAAFPIQVFGNTAYFDPEELARDFTVTRLTRDKQTNQLTQGSFTLSKYKDRVVWYQIFGTW